MITVINKANKGLYNQLFRDVEKWLYTHNQQGEEVEEFAEGQDGALLGLVDEVIKDPETGEIVATGNQVPDTITSLEQLFEYMYFITNFAPIYTRLPLDEEPFFIDADKRTISVPRDFASNGVSVQGDEVSEILFFKINRFFDATDLSQCKIFIQWQSSETDEKGNPKEGVSKPWIQDIVSEPGYLIFGWPISSKITKVAGTVTFSVRFYRLDEADKLVYSFSTLDQTVTVKPALDYDIEDIANDTSSVLVDDMAANIMLRAINSPTSSADTEALQPYWEPGVEARLQSDVIEYKNDGSIKFYIRNLNTDERGFSVLPINISIAALSDDSGVISYIWKKVDKEGNGQLYCADRETKFYKPVEYVVTDVLDENRIENKTYYYKDGDKFKAIAPATTFASLREEDKEIYELVSTAILDEVGKYTASAQNRVGKVFSDALIADPIYVPMPVAPELGELVAGELTGPILNAEEPVVLSLSVDLADEFGNDVKNSGGKATYVWHRRPLGEAVPEDLDSVSEFTESLPLTLSDEEDHEGWYSVTVTNHLNKEALSSDSNEIRVTKPACKVSVTLDTVDDLSYMAARERQGNLGVTVTGLEPDNHRVTGVDDVTYQWYRYIESTGDFDVDKEAAKIGMYADDTNGVNGDKLIDSTFTADDRSVASATTPNFLPPEGIEATYFCVVTNHYNGTTRSVASPFYHVTL